MIDTKALREKVLDLAIRGKLVPQDPNDEPASVLLERIREQKKQMVKEGRLKARDIKDDSIIFVGDDNLHYEKFADGTVECIEDEIPFELPDGWSWTRVRNIASVKGGKRVPKGMTFSAETTQHAYIRVTDMKNHTVNLSDLKYIDDAVFSEIKNYTIAKNDLYITIAGTIGAVGEFPDELDGMNLTENAVKVSAICINKSFLCFMLQTEFVQKQFKYKTYQVAMPKLGIERILTTLIPVCGLETQQRICNAINDSTKYIDIINENYQGLSDAISVIKSKILDLAIRGKLIPQNPNDEPASVLLERIKTEKEELIKSGKIKRDKKESIIFKGEDNSYYQDLPESWACCYMSEVSIFERGVTFPALAKESLPTSDNIACARTANVQETFDINDLIYIDKSFMKNNSNKLLRINDIIISTANSFELVGKSCIVDKLDIAMTFGGFVTVVRGLTLNSKYLYLCLKNKFLKGEFSHKSTQTTNIANITSEDLSKTIINLPPLPEQKRIVEAVEVAFAQLDEITNSIS